MCLAQRCEKLQKLRATFAHGGLGVKHADVQVALYRSGFLPTLSLPCEGFSESAFICCPRSSPLSQSKNGLMKFTGTENYVATEDLTIAVNAAIFLQRPLLVKGEPGTGKTVLAEEIAQGLGAPLITWHVKSTTKAQQGLYEYAAVSRLRDSPLGDKRVGDIRNYNKRGKLRDAFVV